MIGSGPFNLGEPVDYRVPDRGLHRRAATTTFVPTAAIVVEIVSPDDETWNKLEFYAAHDVDELLIVNPRERSVTWLELRAGSYVQIESSALLGISSALVGQRIDWPALG